MFGPRSQEKEIILSGEHKGQDVLHFYKLGQSCEKLTTTQLQWRNNIGNYNEKDYHHKSIFYNCRNRVKVLLRKSLAWSLENSLNWTENKIKHKHEPQ